MKKIVLCFSLIVWVLLLNMTEALAQIDARMLRQPDVSDTHIAFSYADDIWVVLKEGGIASRLTSAKGTESFPRFSPDGSVIAYNANYDGNEDIYVVSSLGGIPNRITHHPMQERVLGWFPDGESVLFSSSKKSGRQRFNQFYKVSAEGGNPEKLPVPYGEFGAISPDGNTIAYTPISRSFRTWKRYRGGMAPDIWLFDLESYESQNITDNPANDEQPMWHGSVIYFLSDQGDNQRNNIWAYNTDSGETRQVTNFNEYDIHFPSIGPSNLVFEAGGRLYLMDLESEEYEEIDVDVITDQTTIQSRTEDVSNLIQDAYISPAGERVLFQARGDVFSVPAEHGPIMNLTQTSGVAERYPAWSPDGKRVAYWSDRSGEYELTLRDESGSGEEQTLTSTGEKFKYSLYWSPDSEKLVFVDNAMTIRMFNVETEEFTDIDKGLWMMEGGLRNFSADWSSDSKWVTYSRGLDHRQSAVFLFNTETGERHQVTSGYYHDRSPAFDPDGKYLYLLTSRTLQPMYSDFDNSWIYSNSTTVAAVPLREDVDSPLAPRNDEVTAEEEEEEENGEDENGDEEESDEPAKVVIDLEGFEERLVELPMSAGNYGNLSGSPGKVVYMKLPRTGADGQSGSLAFFDLEEREEQTVIEDIFGYQLSANNQKVLVASGGGRYGIIDLAPDQTIEIPLRTSELSVTVYPREEWQQIFNDSWRFVRDYFYDPNFHGVDWQAVKKRYQAMLDDAITRNDVNYVIGEMIAELNASHTYRGGGDIEAAETRDVGLLGIDWELENGAYRIENIIKGAQWDNEIRSPLDMPGVEVSEGDYILAVNGERIDTSKDPYEAFQGLAGKTIELTVNDSPEIDGARKVVVEAIGAQEETRLRHLAWIEANRQRVDEATDGRVGYIYVRSTGIDAQNELVRQFMAQHEKDALIIDERFNSGGQIPDRFIELLDRPEVAHWAVRDGKDWKWPPIAHFGPKVMLINGWSGSGGDAFPAYFKEVGLGPLIGTTTWGGLIGISGSPDLIDGGGVTVPTFRMYYPNGEWFPEGGGVQPDIHVVDDPTQLANGTDPQLERAIEEVERLMRENPDSYTRPERPEYEDRTVDN